MPLLDRIQIYPRSAGSRNDRGNTVYTWPDANAFWLEGVGVAPAESDETDTNGRTQQVTTGVDVYSEDYDVPVKSHDRAKFEGTLYEVQGRVARWRDPFTLAEMGSVIHLQAVTDDA